MKLHQRKRARNLAAGSAAFALFAGMLFWTKLKVTHPLPRSAYAEPEPREEAGDDAGGKTAGDPDGWPGSDNDGSDNDGSDDDGSENERVDR